MGHKANPIGLRLQINRTWDSRWYAEGKNYAQMLEEDLKMRKFIDGNAAAGGDFEGGDRTSGQAVPRFDLCRPPWCDHRQEGRGHRKAAARSWPR